MKTLTKKLTWFWLFSMAMGFLEAAVVVYLRELYYSDGFEFPLRPMPYSTAVVEIFREAATIIMLVGVGIIAGKTKLQRFAFFSLAFGIWDLCYYLFLYLILGWPQSLFTWDLLFLIPVPWVGPVWAPCLLSTLMIVGASFVIAQCEKDESFVVSRRQWTLLLSGALICIGTFMLDFLMYYNATPGLSLSPGEMPDLSSYRPSEFNAALFFTGFLLMCAPVVYSIFKNKDGIK